MSSGASVWKRNHIKFINQKIFELVYEFAISNNWFCEPENKRRKQYDPRNKVLIDILNHRKSFECCFYCLFIVGYNNGIIRLQQFMMWTLSYNSKLVKLELETIMLGCTERRTSSCFKNCFTACINLKMLHRKRIKISYFLLTLHIKSLSTRVLYIFLSEFSVSRKYLLLR